MDQSKGVWITFQDADDASLLNRIEVQYNLAKRYNALCVTTSLFPFKNEFLNKCLDAEKILREESGIVITPDTINAFAKIQKGCLCTDGSPPICAVRFKKRLPTRPLFIGTKESYPGSR